MENHSDFIAYNYVAYNRFDVQSMQQNLIIDIKLHAVLFYIHTFTHNFYCMQLNCVQQNAVPYILAFT